MTALLLILEAALNLARFIPAKIKGEVVLHVVKFISYTDVSAYLRIALCVLKIRYLSCAVTSLVRCHLIVLFMCCALCLLHFY